MTWQASGYRHRQELGGGRTGRAWLAVEEASGELVVIKYLNVEETYYSDVSVELDRLSALDAAYYVRIRTVVRETEGVAVVLDPVNGAQLRALIRDDGALAGEASLLLYRDSLTALGSSVHGDYRPENVIVSASGNALLMDVRMAAWVQRDVSLSTGVYLAPERWHSAELTAAADVYAATVTYFELLVGEPPYWEESQLLALRFAHENADLPVEALPEGLRDLVRLGLAKDVAERLDVAGLLMLIEGIAISEYGADWEAVGRAQLVERVGRLSLPLGDEDSVAAVGFARDTEDESLDDFYAAGAVGLAGGVALGALAGVAASDETVTMTGAEFAAVEVDAVEVDAIEVDEVSAAAGAVGVDAVEVGEAETVAVGAIGVDEEASDTEEVAVLAAGAVGVGALAVDAVDIDAVEIDAVEVDEAETVAVGAIGVDEEASDTEEVAVLAAGAVGVGALAVDAVEVDEVDVVEVDEAAAGALAVAEAEAIAEAEAEQVEAEEAAAAAAGVGLVAGAGLVEEIDLLEVDDTAEVAMGAVGVDDTAEGAVAAVGVDETAVVEEEDDDEDTGAIPIVIAGGLIAAVGAAAAGGDTGAIGIGGMDDDTVDVGAASAVGVGDAGAVGVGTAGAVGVGTAGAVGVGTAGAVGVGEAGSVAVGVAHPVPAQHVPAGTGAVAVGEASPVAVGVAGSVGVGEAPVPGGRHKKPGDEDESWVSRNRWLVILLLLLLLALCAFGVLFWQRSKDTSGPGGPTPSPVSTVTGPGGVIGGACPSPAASPCPTDSAGLPNGSPTPGGTSTGGTDTGESTSPSASPTDSPTPTPTATPTKTPKPIPVPTDTHNPCQNPHAHSGHQGASGVGQDAGATLGTISLGLLLRC